ncbi:hypothetical protein HMPREF0765_3179 [Sphingobacterium spiritivorum ATCC 33300]|uniref:Uncharacterized protein n=1 Tax=Sphingobacterium spiritivorum ATCC 33300 TaxID=525372 RepID=C2G0S3_SPHSI|nr:hypothetical protein [Sphingobacterium spiritivorum]EEI91153.1 hypothetical protein HMPREF0765_3179 [Sphingobacterium spiritivorum ATCC 33300]
MSKKYKQFIFRDIANFKQQTKMKKFLLALVVTGAMVTAVKAQTAAVKVNVILNPIQSISLGEGASNDVVNLEYKTVEDYKNGVSKTVNNQLYVTSIGGGYKIKAKSSVNNPVATTAAEKNIDGSTVTVKIEGKGTTYTNNIRDLVAGKDAYQSTATSGESLNVTYAAAGNNAYVDKVLNKQKTTYTVNVVYEITAE